MNPYTDYFYKTCFNITLPEVISTEVMAAIHAEHHAVIQSFKQKYWNDTSNLVTYSYTNTSNPQKQQARLERLTTLSDDDFCAKIPFLANILFFRKFEYPDLFDGNLGFQDVLLIELLRRFPEESLESHFHRIKEQLLRRSNIITQEKDGTYYWNIERFILLANRFSLDGEFSVSLSSIVDAILERAPADMSTLCIKRNNFVILATEFNLHNIMDALCIHASHHGIQLHYERPHLLVNDLCCQINHSDPCYDYEKMHNVTQYFNYQHQHVEGIYYSIAMNYLMGFYSEEEMDWVPMKLSYIPQNKTCLYHILDHLMRGDENEERTVIEHLSFLGNQNEHDKQFVNYLYMHFGKGLSQEDFNIELNNMLLNVTKIPSYSKYQQQISHIHSETSIHF